MIKKYNRWLFAFFIIAMLISFPSKAQNIEEDSLKIVEAKDVTNIAYGSQPSWMVTSALSSVKGSDLKKSFTSNLANTLYGRLPGLTVRQGSGEPGADSPTLNGRGISTFGTSSSLLVIVDGFESTFEQLDPEEVETVQLLKDASATAIYGGRGANGVLLVTTKRGTVGSLVINFSTQQGYQTPTYLPEFLGSSDYAGLYNEALANEGKQALYTPIDLEAYRNGSDPYFHPDVNWYNEVLRKSAPVSNYNLSFTGGDKTIKYYVLIAAVNSNGLYRKSGDLSDNSMNSQYSRYNFRANADIVLTKRLSAYLTLGGTVEDKANPAASTTSGIFSSMASLPPNAFPVYTPNGLLGGTSLLTNPLGNILETGWYTSNGRTLQATLKITEQLDMISKGMSISAAASTNNYFRSYSNKSRQYARYSVAKNLAGETIYTKFGQNTSLAGDESQTDQWRNTVFQVYLNYNKTFGKNYIEAMLMYNADNYSSSGISYPYKHTGINGRATYSKMEKYIAELSFSYSGTEAFQKGKRFGLFPAASIGWIVSKEEFLKGNSIVNFLKIRGSYGLVGNDDIGTRFMWDEPFWGSGSYYFGTGNVAFGGMEQGTVGNFEGTWEKQKTANIGIDATLSNHFEIGIDLFNNDRYDILSPPDRTIPSYLGAYLPSLNVGKVNNKGFEAKIRFKNKSGEDIQYFLEANMWYAKNKIIYNAEAIQLNDYLYRTGHQIGQPFLYECIGYFKDANDIAKSPIQNFSQVMPGDLKYKDQNNDGIINQQDLFPQGKSGLPEITYTFHTGISYKSFDFDMLFQGVANRMIYLSGNYYQAFQNNGKVSEIALGRWTPSTAETATYPRLTASNNLNNFQYSSFWQRNGSYLKLRSIEIGYTVPKEVLKRVKLQNVRIFVNGTNLFEWDKVDFVSDPETLSGYPAVKTLSIGTKIQF
jgi:TonB-linked SusC/RagA family outer membrane protein